MLTFLAPSALLALLGLLVPVAIHLWNRRPGQEVAVGSVRWLVAGANRRLRNLKPEQLPLLLLRGALLATLALAVAGPVWRQPTPPGRGQVLISPALADNPALETLRPALDSLRRRGYRLRWLAPGFPALAASQWPTDSLGNPVPDPATPAARPTDPAESFLWARVQQAADSFSGQPLVVVAPQRLFVFGGTHPPLPARVRWHLLPDASETTWLQAAAQQGDSLRLWLGQSGESLTRIRPITVRRPAPGSTVSLPGPGPFRYESTSEGAGPRLVSTPADGAAPYVVPVRTRPFRVALFAGRGYAEDARYVRAAVQAAAVGLPGPLELAAAGAAPGPSSRPDWLFWLAAEPLPAAWRAAVPGGLRVWQPAAGPGRADSAFLVAEGMNETNPALFRRDTLGAAGGELLWTTGAGHPVLSRRAEGRGAWYRFHSRLLPTWSELADSPALPALFLALLHPDPTLNQSPQLAALDQRQLDPTQLSPPVRASAAEAPPLARASRQQDLRPWLVLLAGLLFGWERLLARRRDSALVSLS